MSFESGTRCATQMTAASHDRPRQRCRRGEFVAARVLPVVVRIVSRSSTFSYRADSCISMHVRCQFARMIRLVNMIP